MKKTSRSHRPRARRFTVRREGYGMFFVVFLSEVAHRAARPLFGADAIWFGRAVVVDHRYIHDIVHGLVNRDGFTLVKDAA